MPTPPTPQALYQAAVGPLRERIENAQRRGPRHFTETMPRPAEVLRVLDLADAALQATQVKP